MRGGSFGPTKMSPKESVDRTKPSLFLLKWGRAPTVDRISVTSYEVERHRWDTYEVLKSGLRQVFQCWCFIRNRHGRPWVPTKVSAHVPFTFRGLCAFKSPKKQGLHEMILEAPYLCYLSVCTSRAQGQVGVGGGCTTTENSLTWKSAKENPTKRWQQIGRTPGSACQGTCREEPLLSQLQDVSDGR